jgi:hypothetical protein
MLKGMMLWGKKNSNKNGNDDLLLSYTSGY